MESQLYYVIKGNTSYIPDDSVTGADPVKLSAFFKRCGVYQSQIQ